MCFYICQLRRKQFLLLVFVLSEPVDVQMKFFDNSNFVSGLMTFRIVLAETFKIVLKAY